MSPPLWKIKREVGRIAQQAKGIGERLTDPVAQRRLDKLVADGLPVFEGDKPPSQRVALFLIYQPSGLKASTIETCHWLARHGYAPFIVSNSPIRESDWASLKPAVWRAVERPNFGYDFGGYRDGLTTLRQWDIDPEELLILNDSVWFPVIENTDILERLEGEPADIAGPIMRKRGAVQFLESYFYRIRRPALHHQAFNEYWRNLQLTSNKYHVIRRGERGFSEAMLQAGIQVAGVYPHDQLSDYASRQTDDFLRQTLKYASYIDECLAQVGAQLLSEGGSDWRDNVIEHITTVCQLRPGYSSFPFAMIKLFHYPFLKKSSEPISLSWRSLYLQAVHDKALDQPLHSVGEELESAVLRFHKSFKGKDVVQIPG